MKRLFYLLILSVFTTGVATAQQTVTLYYPGSTATQLVDKLVGTGVTYSNAQLVGTGWYNGSVAGDRGFFSNGSSSIGINSGIILSTGDAMLAYGPNVTSSMSTITNTGSDATLQAIAGNTTYDAIGVQFDFIPESNYIEFKYVFSSEEYNEYVGDVYNDVFGFFVTSLSSDGYNYNQKNIAIVPGTTNTPVAINNVNNGYAGAGSLGPGGSGCTNCAYYRDNALLNTSTIINVEYDGMTTVLTASCNVVPCAPYRMKIVIADVYDQVYDSAVFLEENSFTSPTVSSLQITYSNPTAGSNSNAVEGCSNAQFVLNLSSPTPMNRNVPFTLSGTATPATDYTISPNILATYNTLFPNQYYVTIPGGSSSTTFSIDPIADATAEGAETVIMTVQSNLCGAPVYSDVSISILDNSTPFSGSVSPSNPSICLGNSIPIAFSGTGGQAPFTYAWSSGQSTSSINANPPTNQIYTVSVTDACGATTTATTQVDVYPIPAGSSVPATQIICSGETTNLYLTGFPSNTAFSWTATASGNVTGQGAGSGGTIAQQLENNGTTDATVTYTITPAANGCTGTPFTADVTVRPHPTAYNVTGGGAFCPGSTGVSVGLDGSESGVTYNVYVNGTMLTSFAGTGSATSSSAISVPGTATIVAVNTTTGCSYNMPGSVTLSYSPVPQFDAVVISDVQSCTTPDGSITVTAGGTTGPYEYAINGGAFSTNNSFTGLNTGFYTISIEDANGCTADSAGIQITSTSGPSINSVDLIHITCPGDSTGQITINADPGVEYSIDNGVTYAATNVFSNLPAGTYYVLIRDAGNCIASQMVTLTTPPAFQITENITNMVCGTLGSASISVQGGTPSYTYEWSHDPTNTTFSASNLTNDTYYVTVTDASGCTVVADLIVGASGGQGTASITALNNVSCNGYADGSATVQLDNGIAPFTYSWSFNPSLNTPTVNNLAGGLYYVTISDAYGCSAVLPVNINEPPAITSTINAQNISCNGAGNGQISVIASGGAQPFSFLWNTSQTTSTITGLQEGSYSVTITDQNGCTATNGSSLINPEAIIVTPVVTQPVCFNDSTGSISLTITGGAPDYTVQWSNGFAGLVNTMLNAGSYTATVTDANGCGQTNTYTVTNPLPMTVTDTSYYTMNGGYAQVVVSGGTAPYSYMWSNNNPFPYIANVPSGEYSVTITDANGCKASAGFEFDIPLVIPTTITPNEDGKNDDFYIMNIQAYNNISIEIYTRWGELIFQYKGTGEAYLDERNRWDGTYNGKILPIGAYLYIINLGDGSEHLTGSVTIIR